MCFFKDNKSLSYGHVSSKPSGSWASRSNLAGADLVSRGRWIPNCIPSGLSWVAIIMDRYGTNRTDASFRFPTTLHTISNKHSKVVYIPEHKWFFSLFSPVPVYLLQSYLVSFNFTNSPPVAVLWKKKKKAKAKISQETGRSFVPCHDPNDSADASTFSAGFVLVAALKVAWLFCKGDHQPTLII